MQQTNDEPGAESEAHLVALIEALLRDCPPGEVDEATFWGEQFDRGLAWVHFPVGHGGLGLTAAHQELATERFRLAGAPSNGLRNFVGVGTAAPSIVAHGNEEQKRRLLRPLFTCEEIWCQLFSEPDAGSDLAALKTSAVQDGDHWIVNGHKVWTTLAHRARWGLLIARTDPDVRKHHGLSFFFLDMRAEGVEVLPIRQISGEAEFNEVLFSDVVVPDSQRIGPVNDGWRITVSTLMSERAHNADLAKKPRGSGPIGYALRMWAESQSRDPLLLDRLVSCWIETEAVRLTAARAEQNRDSASAGAEASVLKMTIGLLTQKVMELCMDISGDKALLIEDYEMIQPELTGETNMGDGTGEIDVAKAWLNARSSTIGGGTTEMQRNAIAERILGLPRDPTPVAAR